MKIGGISGERHKQETTFKSWPSVILFREDLIHGALPFEN